MGARETATHESKAGPRSKAQLLHNIADGCRSQDRVSIKAFNFENAGHFVHNLNTAE